jgi:hypothetical protein
MAWWTMAGWGWENEVALSRGERVREKEYQGRNMKLNTFLLSTTMDDGVRRASPPASETYCTVKYRVQYGIL